MLWYCRRIRRDPARSIVGISSTDAADARELVDDVALLTARQKLVLAVFFAAFGILIYGFVPWADVMDTVFGTGWPLPTFTSSA